MVSCGYCSCSVACWESTLVAGQGMYMGVAGVWQAVCDYHRCGK